MIEQIRRSTLVRRLPERLRRLLRHLYRSTFLSPHKRAASGEVEAVVTRIFQLAIGRTPNPEERQLWTNEVLSNRMSVAEMIDAIAASPEAGRAGTKDAREVDAVVAHIYQLAFERTPSAEECQPWTNEVLNNRLSVAGLINTIANSPEADLVRQRVPIVPNMSNGRFIQFAYECLMDRSPTVSEVIDWDQLIKRRNSARGQLVLQLFAHHAAETLAETVQASAHDPSVISMMGADLLISIKGWQTKIDEIGSDYQPVEPKRYASLSIPREPRILVSAIASLYRGGDYIEQFLENITSQTIFATHCELIIVDADSPEGEAAVIARYMERFPNIVYHRASTRIGIYEAWNLGIQMSKGKYLTNSNLDDLRRSDSFERQVEILEKFPFVDIVYQDFYYSFDGKAPFAKSAAAGFRSQVPVITLYNLMQSNSPHNAPMWRSVLHDEVGLFDASFQSAGDHEFWLRCAQAGKTFFKINDPHIIYFINPEGLSTRPSTRGIVEEAQRIRKRHGRKILSPWLLSSDEEFVRELSRLAGVPVALGEAEQAAPEWRYNAAQRALRLLCATSRDPCSVRGH